METVCFLSSLMHKARVLGDARKSGDAERIRKAQDDYDSYVELCLKADRLITGLTVGDLTGRGRTIT